MARIKFTRHATEKFDLLSRFGFKVSQDQVITVITAPDKTERRGIQTFSTKVLDKEFALRVVHEERRHYSGDNLLPSEEKEVWFIG